MFEDSSVTVPHLSVLKEWTDDTTQWPDVGYISIVNYLIFSEGVDGWEYSYKSAEAYSYLHSNKIGKVLLKKHSKFIFLKAAVEPSHSNYQAKRTPWIMLKESGVVETGGCSCIAGLGKSCSHAAAILWKIFINPNIYLTLKALSHAILPFLSMACRAQGTDMFVVVRSCWCRTQDVSEKSFHFSWIVVATNKGTCCTWAHCKNNLTCMT